MNIEVRDREGNKLLFPKDTKKHALVLCNKCGDVISTCKCMNRVHDAIGGQPEYFATCNKCKSFKSESLFLKQLLKEQMSFLGGLRTARTYLDDVMSHIKHELMHKFKISEKAFGSLDTLWKDIDELYWKRENEISPVIKKFEDEQKRPEYCAEHLLDTYFKEYKFKQFNARFGQIIKIKVSGVVHPNYDWSYKYNSSVKFLGRSFEAVNLGANIGVFIFKLVGMEPALINMIYYEKSSKKILKKHVYRIYVDK